LDEIMGSYTNCVYHIIFATKYRKPLLRMGFREAVYTQIEALLGERGCSLLQIGGVEDHVHLLARIATRHSVADIVRDVKAFSSKWINDRQLTEGRFRWQLGYSAFTVSHSLTDSVDRYIRNQEEHHRTLTFQEEYTQFLLKHDIQFDPARLFQDEFAG
jgi:putative transposase